MTFAIGLQRSLRNRTLRAPVELAEGRSLEEVLSRHLLAVESSAGTRLVTSILLLDGDRKRLWHAAAPSLPQSYCEAINGAEIGPAAGSCGTAAFLDRAIYVTDIATDALWSDYRHLALPHGLRACWSTPIRDSQGVLVGTFAVYHLTPRRPTREEVDAISLITDHVAQAIEWSRDAQDLERNAVSTALKAASLQSVSHNKQSDPALTVETRGILKSIASDFEELARTIECAIEAFPNIDALRRARRAAERGAQIARKRIGSD